MKRSGLGHFPLGQAVPASDHAVCVSLPTVSDLIGYEKKDPSTLKTIKSGYPRFVRNHLINQVDQFLRIERGIKEGPSFFFQNIQDCKYTLEFFSIENYHLEEVDDAAWLSFPTENQKTMQIGSFIQHSGTGVSSRWAEDFLIRKGLLNTIQKQNKDFISAETEILKVISLAHGPEIFSDDVLLASSGANAFYSFFKVAHDFCLKKKRFIWIRLGWLYLDTIEIMELLTLESGEVLVLEWVEDFTQLKKIFHTHGDQLAGLVTEFPTNPLLHSCSLQEIKELCEEFGVLLVVDPTMVSPKNAKVSKYADVVINSLTKYANWQGDVMMGSLVFPKLSKLGRGLMEEVRLNLNPPFYLDIAQMGRNISFYNSFIEQTNKQCMEVANFLLAHDQIKQVYWAYQGATGKDYEKIAGTNRPGCVLSFEIKGNFESFYDSLEMLKSPSFGTEFSLCCPYVYLAHYDLINKADGQIKLRGAGLSPFLCRLSVGLEPVDQITEVLGRALSVSAQN